METGSPRGRFWKFPGRPSFFFGRPTWIFEASLLRENKDPGSNRFP